MMSKPEFQRREMTLRECKRIQLLIRKTQSEIKCATCFEMPFVLGIIVILAIPAFYIINFVQFTIFILLLACVVAIVINTLYHSTLGYKKRHVKKLLELMEHGYIQEIRFSVKQIAELVSTGRLGEYFAFELADGNYTILLHCDWLYIDNPDEGFIHYSKYKILEYRLDQTDHIDVQILQYGDRIKNVTEINDLPDYFPDDYLLILPGGLNDVKANINLLARNEQD